jgi:DNA helicase-2/ATP-dependent DNA helicase PcrA
VSNPQRIDPAQRQDSEPAEETAHDPAGIPAEEETLLARVAQNLSDQVRGRATQAHDYDTELITLRDQIAEARLEDVPALVAQMERLQMVAARRAEALGALVDPSSPYFGHLRLREEPTDDRARLAARLPRERDVLIGRATYVDAKNGVRIVDWRHAPVSQLYYRYPEGSFYEETFGDREVEGEIVARRTVTIHQGELLRVTSPQGVFTRGADGFWHHADPRAVELSGGEGSATRPKTGVLGTGPAGGQREDRHLAEITALIDPRQFELITKPDTGLVVIQGGAGSGKTTIGLHRMAYLAYANRHRFQPERMQVITSGPGLASYIGEVLPSLGTEGVLVTPLRQWAGRMLKHAVPWLGVVPVVDDAPSVVTRLKKHPAVLHALERRVEAHLAKPGARRDSRAIVELWADLLTDKDGLIEAFAGETADPIGSAEISRAHRFCADRCPAVLEADPRDRPEPGVPAAAARAPAEETDTDSDRPDDDDVRGEFGVDGLLTEDSSASIDPEDVVLLLRLTQLVKGPLRAGKKGRLWSHLFVDEAQDLSPIELAVLVDQTTDERSITLAGDTAQRLYLENGFTGWERTLVHLGLSHVAVEPLKIAYRSTREILEVARHALGPLADPEPPIAPRSGAPVEAHRFPDAGAAVAFLGDALRPLFAREPRATVAVLARYPEQADIYYEGLKVAEVPYLRRVRSQDFSFRPGVEVTEIRQVKGLEYDYVILVDVNQATFSTDEEARHLFNIAATRAAHQLWLIVTGTAPSPLILPRLLEPT